MSKRRGFTLVEVLVVVVLVGILSTLAIVGYRRYTNAVKTAEATHNIAGIAQAQQAIKSETGSYINVSGQLANLYPATTPGEFKTEWGGPCNGCLRPWTALAFHPSAPVTFGYSTVASRSAVPADVITDPGGGPANEYFKAGPQSDPGLAGGGGSPGSKNDLENPGEYLPDATGPYFTVVAKADTDGNGVFTTALYYSETNSIVFDQAGE
jgi:prepilin-type N-terminal cleavage/methylation domain-containing protein